MPVLQLVLGDYFFPKNDMMLPWPPGLPVLPLATFTAGFFLGGAGSSSENDSQVASSRVTITAH